ncbi:MAG: metallopeptidase family protein [Oscillospiraceae bacterium]|nr:metallopeptidase family protein [Oscillospiraceae bacterium]
MLSFEAAGALLDGYMEELPEEIFADLNGGVNLLPEEKRDGEGDYIMGLYHHDSMGRYVELFYGSFQALYGDADDETVAEELKKTLHHELTHHLENKAGDRTLEHWDEEQKLLREQGEPLEAGSVLFVDGDGALSAEAAVLLRERLPEIPCAGAALDAVTAETLEQYDAALCMTLDQAEALAERFPEEDDRILCLGEKDILPPLKKARRQLRREIAYLAEELRA